MTPADLGLPETPWYGARWGLSWSWHVDSSIDRAMEGFELPSLSISHPIQMFEVAAFNTPPDDAPDDARVWENYIIAGPVKVIAEVTVRKVE